MSAPTNAPTRRDLLRMIGTVAGSAAMYQAMSSLGLAATPAYKGPVKLTGPRTGKKVLILGAGVAGMCAAYELRQAGYDVKILEYQNRSGGRALTIRGGDRFREMGGEEIACDFESDGYLNPGPWRLPVHHQGVFDYARRLNIPMRPFIQLNQKAYLHSPKAFGGKPQRVGHIEKDVRGHVSELLAKATRQGALNEMVTPEDQEMLLEGLRGWGVLDKNLQYRSTMAVGEHRGWDIRPGGGLMPKAKPSTPIDLSPLLQSGLWDQLFNFTTYAHEMPMFEPVGGIDGIARGFARQVSDIIQMGARVTRIQQSETGVTVTYEDGGRGGVVRQESADWCICTIPLSVLAQLEVDCSDAKKKAIAAVPYASAFKVAIEFKRRFWEQDDHIMGGVTYTDLPIVQIAYPSYDFFSDGPAVVQAAYDTFTAQRTYTYSWNSLSPKERVQAALYYGSKIHPQYLDEYMSGVSWAWHRNDWTLGCYGQWTEELRAQHYDTLCEIDGRLVLAGEHCSHVPAWIEGAILSANDTVLRLDQKENA